MMHMILAINWAVHSGMPPPAGASIGALKMTASGWMRCSVSARSNRCPAHTVTHHDMRPWMTGTPLIKQSHQIVHPRGKIIDMADTLGAARIGPIRLARASQQR